MDLDYYDRFEWLLRTKMRAANDNLIVERRRTNKTVVHFTSDIIANLQYGDKVIVESMETIADTTAELTDVMFNIVTSGIDVVAENGEVLVDAMARADMIPYIVAQRIMSHRERLSHQQAGIE